MFFEFHSIVDSFAAHGVGPSEKFIKPRLWKNHPDSKDVHVQFEFTGHKAYKVELKSEVVRVQWDVINRTFAAAGALGITALPEVSVALTDFQHFISRCMQSNGLSSPLLESREPDKE